MLSFFQRLRDEAGRMAGAGMPQNQENSRACHESKSHADKQQAPFGPAGAFSRQAGAPVSVNEGFAGSVIETIAFVATG